MSDNHSYHVFQIPVHLIQPNPSQPRRVFDEDMLKELAESIRLYGILQPISIRKIMPNVYELVAGERRLRAAKLIEMETIPSLIVNVTEKDSAVLALIENLQRENLNYMEEAKGYEHLIDDYELKQQELAKQLGKGQSTIANKLRLLTLSARVQESLLTNELSERHARALLKMPSEEMQLAAMDVVVKHQLNVKDTEKLIQRMINEEANPKTPEGDKPTIKRYLKDIRIFTNTIKQAVDMVQSSGLAVDYKIKQTDENYVINITIPIENQ